MFLDLDNDTMLIKILKPCIFGLALSLCTRALTVLEKWWVGGWTGGRVGGRVVDYNATSWPPTDQLKLVRAELSEIHQNR